MNDPRSLDTPPHHDGLDMDHLADYNRMSAIARFDLLDPDLIKQLDEVCRQTMAILGRESSLVTIVLDSAQLVLSSAGLSGWICDIGGTPIEWSFCGHTVSRRATYVVEDATTESAHQDSPLVTQEGIRAYAGHPLTTPDGHILGVHCVLDSQPHTFTQDELAHLQSAADAIMRLLSQHRL